MKIAIAGAGAMGSVYGHMLHQGGNQVVLLDNWERHVKQINKFGLFVDECGTQKTTRIPAYAPKDYKETVDLIIMFTKSLTLREMLEDVKHLIHQDTKVLCLLNGLGHAKTIAEYVKEENILMGVTVLTASLASPGSVGFTSYGKTEIQNINAGGEATAFEIVEIFNAAGLPCEYSKNIMWSIWRKACLNGSMNSLCTILDCNMLGLGSIHRSRDLIYHVIHEFRLIALTEGVELDEEAITDWAVSFTKPSFPGAVHNPSMHQDVIKNHRLSEIDYLNGYVARRGRELGLPTPYNDLITMLVHGKEKLLNIENALENEEVA